MENKKIMQLLAVVKNSDPNKKAFWHKVGLAFQNADGSWNLRFDLLPARIADTTIQMREMRPREDVQSPR